MIDFFGNPIIEEEIMQHFDMAMQCFDTKIRGGFGNTPAILQEAQKDLAADNAAAAKAEYGRGLNTGLDIAIDKLISAGCALSNQCEYAPLRAQWWACVKYINDLRGVENDQS